MGTNLRNILVVARREFTVRARTRAYRFGTVLLVIGAAAVALAPVGIRWIDRQVTTKVAVASTTQLGFDPVARFAVVVNAGSPTGDPAFDVSGIAADVARPAVERGGYSAVLLIDRPVAGGELALTVITKEPPGAKTSVLVQQAASAIAIADRLARLGIAPADQANLFAPAAVTVEPPTPPKPGQPPETGLEFTAHALLGQVLVIFLFMAIILYGQWIATSVAEEKASRVVEIVLTAATPFQLLGGKVLGVGGLGLVQFAVAVGAALLGIVLQGQIAALAFGEEAGSIELPTGLTADVFVVFAVLFVLGFLLYAVLYAAAGSTVSRMEDVNNVVTPMSLVGVVGYFVAVYLAAGLIPADAAWVTALSFVPFFSPYMILSRFLVGEAGPLDVALGAAILIVSIVVCLWVAARIYEAGLLAYGQKAGIRRLLGLAFGRR